MRGVVALIVAPLFAGVGAVAFALAAPVHADSDDTVFLRAIHSHGLSFAGGDQDAIELAREICGLLGHGYSMNTLAANGALHASHATADEVKFMVQTSAAAYCPQYIS